MATESPAVAHLNGISARQRSAEEQKEIDDHENPQLRENERRLFDERHPKPSSELFPLPGEFRADVGERKPADEVQEYIWNIDCYSDGKQLDLNEDIELRKLTLTGYAYLWFRDWLEEQDQNWDNKSAFVSRFRVAFQEKFFPVGYKDEISRQFWDLKQGTMSAQDFTIKFCDLYYHLHSINAPITETVAIHAYSSKLDPQIRLHLRLKKKIILP